VLRLVDAVWLSILQGIGEFLPISSSGHLVIYKKLFGQAVSPAFENGGIEVFLHLASLLSIFVFFRKKIISILRDIFVNKNYELLIFVVIATIPTGVIGILLKKSGLNIFTNLSLVLTDLFLTGVILIIGERLSAKKKESQKLSLLNSFWIGVVQGISVLPGISRSGSTISFSMMLGISKEEAAEFSFLIAIPAILGAIFVERKELFTIQFSWMLVLTFVLTFVLGILALKFLFSVLKKGRFSYFGYYCILISLLGWGYYWLR
jgi:undecaprenyl-diphosphatase